MKTEIHNGGQYVAQEDVGEIRLEEKEEGDGNT